ncbi:MAG: 1-acyl-sn-glycerol-3-phosphate acyltransferase [Myxococcales bacterium]
MAEPSERLSSCARLATRVGRLLLRLAGWRAQAPESMPSQFILIAAPHTSNWDVYFMLACGWALGLRVSWIAKDTLFRFPFGRLVRWLGGVPVDRSRHKNQVQAAAALFRDRPALILAVAPEGTRSRAEHWRSGFYYMALEAHVPIGLGFLDYGRRIGGIQGFYQPTGDIHADMAHFRAAYRDIRGKFPAQETPARLRDETGS